MSDKHCVFCLERPSNMTEEHVWGDWVTSYVPRTMNKHNHANVFVPRPGDPDPAELRIRAGDPLSSQVKVVCGDCNSGWLNRIQEAARPLLLPLFEGAPHTIDAKAQAKIATWIAMATMTGEFMSQDERRVAVAQADRSWLMAHSTVPSNCAFGSASICGTARSHSHRTCRCMCSTPIPFLSIWSTSMIDRTPRPHPFV
jgi:hypothetical protein